MIKIKVYLSKEQLTVIVNSLGNNINQVEKEMEESKLQGNARDMIEESLAVHKATKLYLDSIINENNLTT